MSAGRPRLRTGNRLPRIVSPPPGPTARRFTDRLARLEPPGINTLGGGARPIVWQEALGANVLDTDGNRYVDLTGGFGAAAAGHRHPEVVSAIGRQSRRLLHGLGDLHAHPLRIELAEALTRLAPFDDARVYFAVSGSDAVEIAIKTAVLATGRPGILAFEGGYHGLTLGALGPGGMPRFRLPFAAHVHPWIRRIPFGADPGSAGEIPEDLAAVLVEPIQGRGGVRVPPPGWLRAVASFAADRGALLVVDEILTGGGRTGPFWAVSDEDVVPDLLCAGKALGGGMPLGVVLGPARHLAAWPGEGEALHTATFVAHPLSCAGALAAIPILEELRAAPQTATKAERLRSGLDELAREFPDLVAEARGRGHLRGLVLREPGDAVRLAGLLLERGVLALPSGGDGEVLELLPPLVLTRSQLDDALTRLRDALRTLERRV